MKIIVLAGGSDQIALIKELKRRGHDVILIDYFDNPPAKPYADKHIVASTLDIERVKCVAEQECVDMICTACTDQALLTVAYVSEKLHLPCYISYGTALNVTNKSYMKKVLIENNIPTAKYKIVEDVNIESVKDFQFPVVVKPVDCNSSKGVKRIDAIDDVVTYLSEAINYSRTRTAIVEEFKSGYEISADFYIENGVVKYLSASRSIKIKNKKSFTILCSEYPVVDDNKKQTIISIAEDIAIAFKLNNCPLLVQLIEDEFGIYVLEFSARMGGGSKYQLIQTLSGVNIMSAYVDMILGIKPRISPSKQVNYCKMVYLYCSPGVFDHIEGLEELKLHGLIDNFFVYKTKGMKITGTETRGDRLGGYLVTAATAEELSSKIKYVDSYIKIIDIEGNDIMLHNLLL